MAADYSRIDEKGTAIVRKVTRRLIPFIVLLYFFNYLDRVNVGFAALTMNQDLAFSATVYGNGAGILFAGLVLFMVPSTIILHKVGARLWIAPIVVLWGAVSAAMAFVQGPVSFYILRFILGAAEAGFFPGVLLYMTYWFPAKVRGRITGLFMMAIPVSSILGAPASTLLLDVEGFGLRGWQWLFLLQGLPAVFLGILVLRYLTEDPQKADWLTSDEKEWLIATLATERRERERETAHPTRFVEALLYSRVWLLGVVNFGIVVGFYGLALWLPQIIKSFGGLTNFEVGLLTTVPYILAAIAMYSWGVHSDRSGERKWHVALPALVGGVALAASAYFAHTPALAFAALTLASIGIYAVLPVFWTLPTAVLSGTAAAGGIALINMLGSTGGYVGPALVGYIHDQTQSYSYGLLTLGGLSIMSAILVLALLRNPKQEPGRV